jgi:alcohol dehydrogenase (cytochrome c)
MPPSFSPATGLFYVSARETCATYVGTAPPNAVKAGDRAMGGMQKQSDRGTGALRAIDPLTLTTKWELKHSPPSWAGVLATAGNVVFTGDADGFFIAADARTGKELYRYQMGSAVYSAAATFLVDGRQFVIMAAGSVLTSFALPAGVP